MNVVLRGFNDHITASQFLLFVSVSHDQKANSFSSIQSPIFLPSALVSWGIGYKR